LDRGKSFDPKSGRWLLEQGRTEEANELILMIALNKKNNLDNLLDEVYQIPFYCIDVNHPS